VVGRETHAWLALALRVIPGRARSAVLLQTLLVIGPEGERNGSHRLSLAPVVFAITLSPMGRRAGRLRARSLLAFVLPILWGARSARISTQQRSRG